VRVEASRIPLEIQGFVDHHYVVAVFNDKEPVESDEEKSLRALEPGGVTMRRRIPLIKRRQDLISNMLAPPQ
jgi:hypothetical protein